MAIPADAQVDLVFLVGPDLGFLGNTFMPTRQNVRGAASVDYLVYFHSPTPDLDILDFQVDCIPGGAGPLTAQVTRIEPAVRDIFGQNGYVVTVDKIAGDGTIALVVGGKQVGTPTIIDTTAPNLVDITADVEPGTYGVGAQITFNLHLDERVGVKGGAPLLALSNGAQATYAGGSGTDTLAFTYTVKAGQASDDLSPLSIMPSNVTISDLAGNAVDWSDGFPSGTGVAVDGGPSKAPTIADLSTATARAGGTLRTGDKVSYHLTLSDLVELDQRPGDVGPFLTLSNGAHATFSSREADDSLNFTYTVAAGDARGALTVTGLDLGGTIARTPYNIGFADPVAQSVGKPAVAITAADLDADGNVDLVTANLDRTISVLFGHGDGTFQDSLTYSTAPSAVPRAIAVGDVNGDGHNDIVVGTAAGLHTFLGTGQQGEGALGAPVFSGYGGIPGAPDTLTRLFKIGISDLDSDGQQEVYISGIQVMDARVSYGALGTERDFTREPTLNVLASDGEGHLTAKTTLAKGPIRGGAFTSLVDMNGDGRLDLVGASANDAGAFYRAGYQLVDQMTGEPIPGSFSDPLGDIPQSVAITWAMDGFGVGADGMPERAPWNRDLWFSKFPLTTTPQVATTGFLMKLGSPAIITAGTGTLSTLEVYADGSTLRCDYATGVEIPLNVVAVDVDGDGHQDVVVGGWATDSEDQTVYRIALLRNYGDGRLLPARTDDSRGLGAIAQTWGNGFVLADVDNDGRSDLIAVDPRQFDLGHGTVSVSLNTSRPFERLNTESLKDLIGDQPTLRIVADEAGPTLPTQPGPPNEPSAGGTVTPGAGQTQTASNVIAGSLTVDGPGTLILTGTSTYAGPTEVNAGTLLVNGSIVSPTTVKAGGTLGGSGSTGTVAIEAGGTLSPGNSPGILATRDLSLAPGAVLKEEIGGTASGQFDQVKVVGSVALNGAKLDASAVNFFSPIRGNSFTLIDNDGTDAVQGSFAGLAEGATLNLGARSLRISYHGGDGNDVVLTDVTGNAAVFGRVETSAASTTGAVYGLYEALLDRAPDPLGLQSFTGAIRSGASLTDVAHAILGSPEHAGRPSAGAAYVESLYTGVLNRSADAAGMAAFTEALASGTSAAAVAVQIATSAEAQGALQPVFDAGVSVPDAITAGVARLYHGVLGRAPDTAGLQAFSGVVQQGATGGGLDGALRALAGVAGSFLTSSEYAGTRGALTDAAFVDSLYLGALGRHAEAAGQAYWTGHLAQGTSRAVVATQIAESAEAQVHLVGQIELGQYLIA